MPITVDNEEYLNTDDAMTELRVSRQHFYTEVKPYLRAYHFGTKKKPWYRKQDILDLKTSTPERPAPPIVIPGIFPNWTQHVRSLGLQVDTLNRAIEIVSLDAESLPPTFRIEPYQQFVKRSRISFINREPICLWASYYPLHLVRGEIYEEMKRDEETDVVKRIAEVHGLVIGWAKDRYSARLATSEEQEALQLLRDEPILRLQRVSYASDKRTLILYSDMTLLATWFAPEHEYPVDIWQPRPSPGQSSAARPAPMQSDEKQGDSIWLSDELVAWRSFARAHHIAETTIQKAIENGRLPVVPGEWKRGRTTYREALDAAGRHAFYEQYSSNPNFTPCQNCPH